MKKLLAIFLALICVFSACGVSVAAIDEDVFDDIIEDQFGLPQEEDEEEQLSSGIHYEVDPLSMVTVLYIPSPNVRFDVPMEIAVTSDTPVAVDHDFLCWRDKETGRYYYPGDIIYVEDKVILVAVWEEKTDNYPGFIRSAIAGLKALVKLIEKFFTFFDAINSTKPVEPTTTAPAA